MVRRGALAPFVMWACFCAKPGAEIISSAPIGGDATAEATALIAVVPTPKTPSAFQGSYTSTAGPLYVPPGWNVRWSDGDGSAGIGEGTLTMTIDLASRRVGGTVDGPLGPAILDGLVVDENVAATIVRKNPGDYGFEGTLTGALHDGHVGGTMNVSSGEASTIRTATFAAGPATR
jgi:hypothetical protein